MRVSIFVGLAASVYAGLPAAAAGQRPQPAGTLDTQRVALAVDTFAQRVFETGATPGLGVAVVLVGRSVYERAFGVTDITTGAMASSETLWYIASTTKSLTGFAAALLAERGALDLDAPITRVLPSAQWHPEARAEDLDVMAFLTHTHGLAGNGPITLRTAYTGQFDDTAELLRLLAHHPPTDSRAFSYSNIGYNVAGFVLEAATGEDWKTIVAREVLTPAGMQTTSAMLSQIDRARLALPHAMRADGTFERVPFGKVDATMHAAGGHVSTLGDLARWIAIQMDAGMIDGRRVFPETVVRNTHRLHVPQERDFAFLHRVGWGIGWDIGTYEGDTIVHRHGGYSGTRSHVSFSPAHRIGVVAQVNAGTGSPATDLIASYVYDLAAGRSGADDRAAQNLVRLTESLVRARTAIREDRDRRAARQTPLPRPLVDYAGAYENDALGTMVWTVANEGGLHVQWGALEGPAEVFDADANSLRIELLGSGQVVEFVFDGVGAATALRTLGETFGRTER